MRSTIAACIFLLLLQATTPSITTTQQQTTAEGLAEADRLTAAVMSLYSQDKIDQAIPLAKRALELRETSLEAGDLRVAVAAVNLAQLYIVKRKYREAELLLVRAIQINQAKLKTSDPAVAGALERYACVLIQRDQYKKLKEFEESRVAELKKTPEHDLYWGNVHVVTEAITMPKPEHPPLRPRPEGRIQIRVNLDEQGRVIKAASVCGGNADLVAASVAAARRARFKPVIIDDKPIRIVGYLVYAFAQL
jgi:hypothetical protein